MLRRFQPVIYEAQSSLPNNHAALLRFRSEACSIAFSIPFKKVKVHKAVYYGNKLTNSVDLQQMNMYSEKVTGEYMNRSIEDLKPVERYIAPDNLISQAAAQLNISYGCTIGKENFKTRKLVFDNLERPHHKSDSCPVISTIPMNVMMDLVGWRDKPEFKFKPIWTYTAKISTPTNLYQTIYYPGNEPYYRCSITGDQLIVECDEDPKIFVDPLFILKDFGIRSSVSDGKLKHQKYGKLLPIDNDVRKRFILHLTEEYGIYSLGRFATWRQLLLDDVVDDVATIERLMNQGGYERAKRSVA